jgi:hypothetical protein
MLTNEKPAEVDGSTFEKDILDDVPDGAFHYQELAPQTNRARKKSLKKVRIIY